MENNYIVTQNPFQLAQASQPTPPQVSYVNWIAIIISIFSLSVAIGTLIATRQRDDKNLKSDAIALFLNWARERQDSWVYAVEFAASLDAYEVEASGNVIYNKDYTQTKQFWKMEDIVNRFVQKNTKVDHKRAIAEERQKKLISRFINSDVHNLSTTQDNTIPEKENKKDIEDDKDKKDDNNKDKDLFVKKEEVVKMRWFLMSYFNLLEGILLAWKHQTVDTDILISQFKPLVKNNPRFPENFFQIQKEENDNFPIPAESYPAIFQFINKVKDGEI